MPVWWYRCIKFEIPSKYDTASNCYFISSKIITGNYDLNKTTLILVVAFLLSVNIYYVDNRVVGLTRLRVDKSTGSQGWGVSGWTDGSTTGRRVDGAPGWSVSRLTVDVLTGGWVDRYPSWLCWRVDESTGWQFVGLTDRRVDGRYQPVAKFIIQNVQNLNAERHFKLLRSHSGRGMQSLITFYVVTSCS